MTFPENSILNLWVKATESKRKAWLNIPFLFQTGNYILLHLQSCNLQVLIWLQNVPVHPEINTSRESIPVLIRKDKSE